MLLSNLLPSKSHSAAPVRSARPGPALDHVDSGHRTCRDRKYLSRRRDQRDHFTTRSLPIIAHHQRRVHASVLMIPIQVAGWRALLNESSQCAFMRLPEQVCEARSLRSFSVDVACCAPRRSAGSYRGSPRQTDLEARMGWNRWSAQRSTCEIVGTIVRKYVCEERPDGEVPEVQELDDANKEEEQSNMNGAYSG